MQLIRKEVVMQDMSRLKPFVSRKYWKRMDRKTKEHYRFLTWIAEQYSDELFLDLGTRAGASAMCLAFNPTNQVLTYDIHHLLLKYNKFDFSDFPNIKFMLKDATLITPEEFSAAKVIFLDISHTSKPERAILRVLDESKFKGFLIMDDVQHYRFPKLRELWEEIDRPKLLVPFAHDTGTGVVSYGEELTYET
jgi:predicted O-methyltransferase YrrM